jgi:hypothetical protein
MDSNKLEAALRRLEDEQFGRTFNMPGIDPAVVGAWFRWLRDIKQEQPVEVIAKDEKPSQA